MFLSHIDERLLTWATPYQAKVLEAINRLGSGRAASRELGIDNAAIVRSMQRLKTQAALRGYSPDHDMTRTVPDGFAVKGVSIYYDSEGKPRGQWVKSRADDVAREAAFREAMAGMADELPRLAPIAAPSPGCDKLLNLFTLTDCHVGMLA